MNDLKTPMAALATGLMLLGVSTPITAQVLSKTTILPAKVHWGYQAQNGPKYWASMADEFALCSSGKRQSPIDLEPEIAQDAQLYSLTFNYRDVGLNVPLPPQQSLFHYSGSLTTPPCSENVNWYVMSQPMQISTQQVNDFRKLVGENARPVQDMNWRSLLLSQK